MAIPINELRIGNIFWEDYGGYKIVTAIGFNNVGEFPNHVQGRGIGFKTSGLFDADKIAPVPLSSEILIACGFETDEITYWKEYSVDGQVLYVSVGHFKGDIFKHLPTNSLSIQGIEIKSLHQLMNLYFALTNTELQYQP